MLINVAVNKTIVNTEAVELYLPTEDIYLKKYDDSRFFGKGDILFAILVKYPTQGTLTILKIETDKQDCTDFIPKSDCKSSWWIQESGIRKEAFELLKGKPPYEYDGYTSITKEEFDARRIELLNDYKKR